MTCSLRFFFFEFLSALSVRLTLCAPPPLRNGERSLKNSTNRFGMLHNILGWPIPDQIWKQVCLTPRLGGLGLRKVADHAEIAFSASWHEAKGTCRENWCAREDTQWSLSQKLGSYKKDEEILKKLIEEAPNPRERQRLTRLKCEHSGAWVCAVPSTQDGNDTVMRPRNFQVAIAMRLGLPVLDEEKSCSLCMPSLMFGDHPACCAMTSDRIHRHNRVRKLLDRICQEGMLSPVMEKKRLLGDVYGRRPGDVTIPVWRSNKGLAIDVAVTSPLASSNLQHSEPCEAYATHKSTPTTTMTSRAPRLNLLRWCSRPQVV